MRIDDRQPAPTIAPRARGRLGRVRAALQPAWVPLCVVLAGAGLMHASSQQTRQSSTAPLEAARAARHLQVPEGFTIERVAGPDLLNYPMFITAAGEGRLFVFESTEPNTMTTEEMLAAPSYHVRLLEDTNLDGVYDTSRIYADRIPFPMGGEVIGDDLYVAAAPDLLRLRDTDGDGIADEREVVLTGWRLNVNGAAMGGPFRGPDGWLYITDARRGFEIRRKEGDVVSGKGARIWRVRPDGSGLEWIAGGGFDNAVEIAFMPTGDTFGTMTYFLEPQDGLRDAIMHWVEGGVYPKHNPVIEEDALTLTGPLMPPMTKLARVAHSGLLRYRSRVLGDAYQGNLFTAQFNTGRVMRHILTQDGATYRTEDEPFMTSTSADAHPTDVLEDADGSLLVVETGGWFIKGCPLSRVAKPEVEGGIYRIRRTDAPVVSDPWGRRLGLETASAADLVTHLHDARPVVRDRAADRLVAIGAASVGPLDAHRRQSRDVEARTAAVFALHRIGTPAANAAVRAALDDDDAMVRTAAARAAGLARDREAIPALERLVRGEAPGVRRQAATALGQIGVTASVPALIDAAGRPGDRFVQHAITHALITLGNAAPLVDALTHASHDVRRVALVALDQMRPSPLQRQHLAPFLAAGASDLWDTGVWVASHHPEWSDLVVSFLSARMDASAPTETTEDVRELMTSFCGEPPIQELVATRLAASGTSATQRLALLDVMQACPVKELPASWVAQFETQLQADDAALRARVLRLIEARNVTALHPRLTAIVADTSAPVAFRLEALSGLSTGRRPLGDAEMALVTASLAPSHEPTVRQRAARILTQAGLTDPQLVALARDHVAGADAFLLPRLVDAFAGNTSADVGRALVAALQGAPDRLDSLSEEDLSALLAAYPAAVQPGATRLMQTLRDRQAERLARLQAVEATLGRGDIDAGRRLFFGKSLCSTCHAVGSNGSRFGPDLTSIGDIRSRHDIVEAILFPSASFAREYDTYRVRTADAVHTGIVKDQLADALIVEVAPESQIRVPRSDVVGIEPLGVSMMPPGLEQMLSASELADLVAFLESLPDPVVVLERQAAPR
jgi:putative membrane-bound dehydrogenase-like protein